MLVHGQGETGCNHNHCCAGAEVVVVVSPLLAWWLKQRVVRVGVTSVCDGQGDGDSSGGTSRGCDGDHQEKWYMP